MLMDGNSLNRDTEHGKALTAQLTRRHGTLAEAIDAANFALSAAEIPQGIRRQARAACEDYFYSRLNLAPDHELQPLRDIAPGLELLSDPMIKVLEDLVEFVVDGEYEDLRELSHDLLDVEDMRRRLEDEFPEAYVPPPREVYRVETISLLEDIPDQEGWRFFLELWTEDGPATLHLEGELKESGSSFEVTLTDILP